MIQLFWPQLSSILRNKLTQSYNVISSTSSVTLTLTATRFAARVAAPQTIDPSCFLTSMAACECLTEPPYRPHCSRRFILPLVDGELPAE